MPAIACKNWLLAASALASLAGAAGAQVQLHQIIGAVNGDYMGMSLCGMGDVNLDGRDDFAVSAMREDVAGTDSGTVRIYSGSDASVLLTIYGLAPHDELGVSIARVPDLDGDGIDDLLAGSRFATGSAPLTGAAYVFSGANGSILRTLPGTTPSAEFGQSVAACGDLNGDGYSELAVGAPLDWGLGWSGGSVTVCSGLDGSLLYLLISNVAADHKLVYNNALGACIASAGDVDADGIPDLIAGAPSAGPTLSGFAIVYSGADGRALYTFVGGPQSVVTGQAVASAGDVDGDGHADLLVGSPQEDTTFTDAGVCRLYSGADGHELASFSGQTFNERVGAHVAGVGDVDLDGRPDFVVSAAISGIARVYSGRTFALLYELVGTSVGDEFGVCAEHAGDFNGDGRPDLLLGAPLSDQSAAQCGSAFAYSLTCPVPVVYCTAKTNSKGCVPSIGFSGTPAFSGGDDFVLTAVDVINHKNGLFFWGLSSAAVPFQGGTLCVHPPVIRTAVQDSGGNPAPPDCSGTFSFHFDLLYAAQQALGPGDTVCGQYWYRDPAHPDLTGTGLSDGIEFLWCP